jgi:hypothetical protein
MFSVRSSRINGLKGARVLLWLKRGNIVHTLSESYGMDPAVSYVRGD